MKHLVLAATLALGSLTAASAMALVPTQDAAPGQQRHMHRDPHKQAMHWAEKLGLSSDQTARLEPILAKHRDGVVAVRQNTALTPDQRRAQMHGLNRTTHEQIAAVLTPDQMQQWKTMRKEHRMQKEQGAPAPAGV